ncbi:MAG: TonB-dependent receptor plug domain-containing protein [Janthinobacterium lividum]
MISFPRLASLRVVCALLATTACPVHAQSLDHAAFEQLFGEPVTDSATGKPQRASDVPAEMDIVSAEDIRRSGADNLPDVLNFVAGLDVRRYGMQDASVGIRGYNTALNPRVLVLLDGRQVYQDDYGLTVWPLIPVALSAIRQIEIIKGPSSALYGFNAVSGVINIVTYDPLRDKTIAVRAEGGSQSQAYGEAVATAQIPGRMGIRLSAEGFRSTEFEGNEAGNTREQPHSGTVALDGRFQLAPGIEWDVAGSIGSVDSDYYIDIGAYVPAGFKANSLSSRLSADTRFGMLQLNAYRNENRTSDNKPETLDHWREDVVVVQANDLVKLGRDHTLRFAGEYRDNTASSLQSFNGRIGYSIIAGSVMWDWQILRSLSFTNALRVDDVSLSHHGMQFEVPGLGGLYHDASLVEPSFNSGIVLKLTNYDTVRLTAARAIQLPSLVDFGYARDIGGLIVAGNTGLVPSTVQNYEIDYDRRLPAYGAMLRLALFAQRTDSTIGSPFGSGITLLPNGYPALIARNFGDSCEAGGEIGIKGRSRAGLRWNISYALALVHDDTPEAELLNAASISYQRQSPTHSVILGAGYSWGRLDLDMQARWQSHIQDFTVDPTTSITMPVTVPNYITMNVRVGYRLTNQITTSLLVEQLNQQSLAETAGLQVDRRFVGGIEIRF